MYLNIAAITCLLDDKIGLNHKTEFWKGEDFFFFFKTTILFQIILTENQNVNVYILSWVMILFKVCDDSSNQGYCNTTAIKGEHLRIIQPYAYWPVLSSITK